MYKYMVRNILIIASALLLVSCSSTKMKHSVNDILNGNFSDAFNSSSAQSYNTNVESSVMFNNLDNTWKHSRAVDVDGVEVTTFVPQHESSSNWSKMIEVTYSKVKPSMSAYKYYRQIVRADFNEQCYSRQAKLSILHRSPSQIVYESRMINCGKLSNRISVGKIIRGHNSVSNISYAVKGKDLDPMQRDQMLHLISTAKIIKD